MIADQVTPPVEALTPGARTSRRAQPDGPRRGNLPAPLTSFVGRTEAVAAVQELLSTTRLLSLTGPGGVGKTRLALEVAAAAQDRFPDGVWWVDLAPLCDAELVTHEVATALGLPDAPTRSRKASILEFLRDRNLLLLLDNCEHLVAACAELVAQLLPFCPGLHILATSREALDIGGETVWPVPPLSLPCIDGVLTFEALSHSEAGKLFLERALAIHPNLELTATTIQAMAKICCRLDGIPLAIELAAARVQVISVAQIAARLDDRFRLLRGGSRLDLPHHQTLEATLDWSYDLLTPPEQELFKRLAVFVAGFHLEAAEAVAGDPVRSTDRAAGQAQEVLDLLSQLVRKSLVGRIEGEQARYRMLETIRQYALMRLQASGGLDPARQRHLAYYLQLAESAERGLIGAEQIDWLRLLDREHDNLRAALAWSRESAAGEDGLRLATALAAFWFRVGYLSEGSSWLERALAAWQEPGPVRVQALYQAARLAQQRGDYERALTLAGQSVALSRQLGDRRGMARAQGLAGWITLWQGKRDAAGPLLEGALDLAREAGDERTVARTLLYLGDLRMRQGMHQQAASLLQEGLELYQRMADGWSMAWALGELGDVARRQGNYRRATAHLQLSLSLYRELDSKPEIPYVLDALAAVAAEEGQMIRAAHLWGAASTIRDLIHAHLPPSYQLDYAPNLAKVRAVLGEGAFATAWAEGRALTLEQGLALAVAEPPAAARPVAAELPARPVTAQPHGLTPREVEVLRLVANGLTDVQIAEQLVISPRTVGKHLQSIYGKLYLAGRSAATRWAIEHHLD